VKSSWNNTFESEAIGAAEGVGSTLSEVGTAGAVGAGEAVGSFAVLGRLGMFPHPDVIKITTKVTVAKLERNTLGCFMVLLLYLT